VDEAGGEYVVRPDSARRERIRQTTENLSRVPAETALPSTARSETPRLGRGWNCSGSSSLAPRRRSSASEPRGVHDRGDALSHAASHEWWLVRPPKGAREEHTAAPGLRSARRMTIRAPCGHRRAVHETVRISFHAYSGTRLWVVVNLSVKLSIRPDEQCQASR